VDNNIFEELVRAIGLTLRRRNVLGGLLGTGLVPVLGWLAVIDAAKKSRRKKSRRKKRQRTQRNNNELICGDGTKRCGEQCIPTGACCGGCGVAQQCCNGACIAATDCCGCDVGEACCSGTCVDLATDGANCNGCANACPSGECIHGACMCESSTDCPGGCTCFNREEDNVRSCMEADFSEPLPLCADDDDCPQGSFCMEFILNCSKPCLG
jgi:hypothetical protein